MRIHNIPCDIRSFSLKPTMRRRRARQNYLFVNLEYEKKLGRQTAELKDREAAGTRKSDARSQ